ncbi:hypothetical protein PIB30_040943 [Stylosanthes scabra]|uniref:Uncharacterized protein n=1 Tax=Stylosanthes scabra TaxID=79078 RepID=A0ABU6QFA8_9FABA|nr:hypothetical protein [Stylosanthes scabra]
MPTGNESEITIARAILIHSIIRGEDLRAEELIEDNIAVIAQGMQGKGKLAFPSTIFKLCKDAQLPMRWVRMCKCSSRMKKKKISQCLSLKEAMRKTMIKGSTNTLSINFSNLKQVSSRVIGNSSSMASQDELWNNTNKFHHQIRKEQDMLAREIQEVKKFQVNQTLMGNRKEPMEKLEQTMGLQQKEMTEIKKQLKERTRYASSRDTYCYWAHQHANPSLTEIAIHQIPDLIPANAEKGRHIFHEPSNNN